MHQTLLPSTTRWFTAARVRSVVILPLSILLSLAAVLLMMAYTDLPREAAYMSGIFLLAALLWSTEALSQATTALLVIGLQIVLLSNPGNWPWLGFEAEGASPPFAQVLRGAIDPVVLLFFGGLLLAQAAVVTGVDKTMAQIILRPFGARPGMVLLGLMLVTAFFSMWMSNTATAAMMIMIIAPLLRDLSPQDRFRTSLGLSIPFAANIGGIGTPIGSPPNAVAVGYLQRAEMPVQFLEWMLMAVPLMLILLGISWVMLMVLFRPSQRQLQLDRQTEPMTVRSWMVVAIFVVTASLWMTEGWHGLPSAVVALLPAVFLMGTGIIRREHVNGIDWDILILIAGGIALGAGLRMTGLDQVLVGLLPQNGLLIGRPFLALAVVATILLSTFMSNTAAANVLLPIGISFGMALGETSEAMVIAVAIALAASMAMALPVSTPPNAIAYARAGVKSSDMAFVGALIGAVGTLLVVLFGGPIIRYWHDVFLPG